MKLPLACIWAALCLATAGEAGAACKCRAKGVIAAEGQTLCIRTPEGPRLARCGKVSNVASWTFLDGPCPQAAVQSPRSLASTRWSRRAIPLPLEGG
ncbi:MAG: hypothetical protein H0T75_24095 [Rhizobiales bacterium]|nr:hypothetical protein [Hyphomicrobiales bacterium]